jgi:hypothetical protein
LIWVKRLAPFILIAAAWFGYRYYQDYRESRRLALEDHLALVTARVWVGTALYHDNPDRYIAYRDSILEAENVARADMFAWLNRYENQPERYLPFTHKVQYYVDSLAGVQDSLVREGLIRAADSLRSHGS